MVNFRFTSDGKPADRKNLLDNRTPPPDNRTPPPGDRTPTPGDKTTFNLDTSMFGTDISNLRTGSSSGLPEQYRDQVLDSVIPRLLESLQDYRQDIDDSTTASKDMYNSMSRQAMKEASQGILDNLAQRNIFSGSVVGDAYGKGMSQIADQYANKGFESAMAAAAMKANEPAILSQAAGLGISSESYNELKPYELLSHWYLNTM
jgi:hypothetical protein